MKVYRRRLANDRKARYVSWKIGGHAAVSLEGRYLLETGRHVQSEVTGTQSGVLMLLESSAVV